MRRRDILAAKAGNGRRGGSSMRIRSAAALALSALLSVPTVSLPAAVAQSLEPQRYTVYCADDRIEVSMWDLAQMHVRRGQDVCQLASYTSSSDADRFATVNFGGEGSSCTC
jgi:hypothetical protein